MFTTLEAADSTLEAAIMEAASPYSEVSECRETQRHRERPPFWGHAVTRKPPSLRWSVQGKLPLTKAASTKQDALNEAPSNLQAASIEAADALEASIEAASTLGPAILRQPVAWRRPFLRQSVFSSGRCSASWRSGI